MYFLNKKKKFTIIIFTHLSICCNKKKEIEKKECIKKEKGYVGLTIIEGSSSPRDKEQNRQLAVDGS